TSLASLMFVPWGAEGLGGMWGGSCDRARVVEEISEERDFWREALSGIPGPRILRMRSSPQGRGTARFGPRKPSPPEGISEVGSTGSAIAGARNSRPRPTQAPAGDPRGNESRDGESAP